MLMDEDVGGHLLILDLFVVASGTLSCTCVAWQMVFWCADGVLNQTANIPDYRLLSLIMYIYILSCLRLGDGMCTQSKTVS